MKRDLIFVSGPQKELAKFRKGLCYSILTDPYFKEYFDVFLFENLPANRRNAEGVYLDQVAKCTIYLGIFGRTYGTPGHDGIAPTEKEFDFATSLLKDRIVLVKRLPKNAKRDPQMGSLIKKARKEIITSSFRTSVELQREVMRSLLLWQKEGGRVASP
ncbi:MAG: DUF4062 domain-containing protein [Pirellulaceae bacterium]